jgi:hypothetical protein
LKIILDAAFEVNIFLSNLIIWQSRLEKSEVCVSMLSSDQILVNNWELHIDIFDQNFP